MSSAELIVSRESLRPSPLLHSLKYEYQPILVNFVLEMLIHSSSPSFFFCLVYLTYRVIVLHPKLHSPTHLRAISPN